jgi:hypothetical protein
MTTSVDPEVHETRGPVPLSSLVEQWVAAGVVSAEQARRMTSYDDVLVTLDGPPPDAHRRRPSTVAMEALGYIGGVVVLVSSILIMNLYWSDLSDGVRATVVALASAALLGAGFATSVQRGDVGVRLRSVLWLAATGAFAGFLALLTADILDLDEADAAALASAGTAAGAAALWWLHRHLPQQMATMVALMVTAGSLVNDVAPSHDSLPGLGAWTVAATWLLLGWGGLLRPRLVVLPLGAAAMVVSASMTLPTNAGFVLAIGTVAFVVALAVLQSDLLLLAVGAMGTLMVLPAAATEWFPDSDAVPFVLLAMGLLLVLAAVWTARRHRDRPREPGRDWGRLPRTTALVAAGVVLVVAMVIVAVVTAG